MDVRKPAEALLWALRGRWHSTVPLEADYTIGALMRELDEALAPRPLPLHRTEAGYPNCSTCDGGGCYDCTDPA